MIKLNEVYDRLIHANDCPIEASNQNVIDYERAMSNMYEKFGISDADPTYINAYGPFVSVPSTSDTFIENPISSGISIVYDPAFLVKDCEFSQHTALLLFSMDIITVVVPLIITIPHGLDVDVLINMADILVI